MKNAVLKYAFNFLIDTLEYLRSPTDVMNCLT